MKINNYLNIAKNYTHLPDQQIVQLFLAKTFSQSGKPFQDMDSCFIVARDYVQAFLLISLCFGGSNIVNQLSQGNTEITEKAVQDANKKLQKFSWDENISILSRFENNAKEYGSQYPFYRQNLFDHISENNAKQVFGRVKNGVLLYGAKIRLQTDMNDQMFQVRRQNEEHQQNNGDDSTFLLIGISKESVIVGVMYKEEKYTTRERKISMVQRSSELSCNRQQGQIDTKQFYIPPEDEKVMRKEETTKTQEKPEKKQRRGKTGTDKKKDQGSGCNCKIF